MKVWQEMKLKTVVADVTNLRDAMRNVAGRDSTADAVAKRMMAVKHALEEVLSGAQLPPREARIRPEVHETPKEPEPELAEEAEAFVEDTTPDLLDLDLPGGDSDDEEDDDR